MRARGAPGIPAESDRLERQAKELYARLLAAELENIKLERELELTRSDSQTQGVPQGFPAKPGDLPKEAA